MGVPELNAIRGYKTPSINKLADQSLRFARIYTEPSCTPTRAAFMTGRRAVRLGIADNTVVVIMGDNGHFTRYSPGSGYTAMIFRGGKTGTTEGDVRVDAFARWPDMLDGDSVVADIVHVTDLYTSLARVAGATGEIPGDRLVDGVDQTALMLLGETHGRRDTVFLLLYQGSSRFAVRPVWPVVSI